MAEALEAIPSFCCRHTSHSPACVRPRQARRGDRGRRGHGRAAVLLHRHGHAGGGPGAPRGVHEGHERQVRSHGGGAACCVRCRRCVCCAGPMLTSFWPKSANAGPNSATSVPRVRPTQGPASHFAANIGFFEPKFGPPSARLGLFRQLFAHLRQRFLRFRESWADADQIQVELDPTRPSPVQSRTHLGIFDQRRARPGQILAEFD